MAKKHETVAARQRNKAASVRAAGQAPAKSPRSSAAGTEVSRKVARSAKSGEFVSKAAAKRAPSTTVVETVKVRAPRRAKAVEEPRFALVPIEDAPAGYLGPDAAMTKGEVLSMLAEEVLGEPVGAGSKNRVAPFKIPRTLAAAADMLYTTRQERLAINKRVEAYKVHERALREHLIDNLPKSDATGAAGKIARAQVEIEDTPVANDWDAVRKHIKKTGDFDLLNKAINRKAIKERWMAGKEVPGIGHFDNVKISITKVGG